MWEEGHTRDLLIEELNALRERIGELEKHEAERSRAEEVLRESEERYKRMLNAVTAYTYEVQVHDGRAVSTLHSKACFAVTGFNQEEYQNDHFLWYSMIHPDDRGAVQEAIHEIMAGREVPPIEHRIIRRDGKVIWIRNTMTFYRDQEGRLSRYDGVVEDITERKLAEEERERLIAQLRDALAQVKILGGLLPICAHCKKIRNDQGYWQQIEAYIHEHSEAEFSHGICPECAKKLYPAYFK